jgi:hypothetical protein
MAPLELTQNIGFHEATLSGVRRDEDGSICLMFEGVHVDNQVRSAIICLTQVRQIIRDGSPVDDFTMECQDCEVLTLDRTPVSLHLIVEWNDFESHRHLTRSYHIACESVSANVL